MSTLSSQFQSKISFSMSAFMIPTANRTLFLWVHLGISLCRNVYGSIEGTSTHLDKIPPPKQNRHLYGNVTPKLFLVLYTLSLSITTSLESSRLPGISQAKMGTHTSTGICFSPSLWGSEVGIGTDKSKQAFCHKKSLRGQWKAILVIPQAVCL